MPCGCANNKNLNEKDLYNKNLNLDAMKNMSIEEIARLYQQGYRLENSNINILPNTYITSLALTHPNILDAVGSYDPSSNQTTIFAIFTNSGSYGYLDYAVFDNLTHGLKGGYVNCLDAKVGLAYKGTITFSGATGNSLFDIHGENCLSGETCPPSGSPGCLNVNANNPTSILTGMNIYRADTIPTPPQPTGLSVIIGNGQLQFSWTKNTNIFCYYLVLTDPSLNIVQSGYLTNTTGTYVFTNLVNGTPYTLHIQNINQNDIASIEATKSGTPAAPTPVLTTITVSPSPATVNVNTTQVFTATAKDQNGNSMSGISLTWTSSNTNLATVSPASGTTNSSGQTTTTLTAKSTIGTLTLSASGSGKTGMAQVSITSPSQILNTITILPMSSTIAPGQTVQLIPTCRDASNVIMTCPTLTWNNSNTTAGSISTSGLFTGIAVGTSSITATGGGKTSNTATVTVSTTPPPTAGGGAGMAVAVIAALGFAYLILKPKPKV